MTKAKTKQQNSEASPFVDLRLVQARLVEETFSATPHPPAGSGGAMEFRTDTSSGFSVGLDSLLNPKSLTIELEYTVKLSIPNVDSALVEYSSKYSANFSIVKWIGCEDWEDLPDETFESFFSMIQHIAIRRAEDTLAEAGLKGAGLPNRFASSKASA